MDFSYVAAAQARGGDRSTASIVTHWRAWANVEDTLLIKAPGNRKLICPALGGHAWRGLLLQCQQLVSTAIRRHGRGYLRVALLSGTIAASRRYGAFS